MLSIAHLARLVILVGWIGLLNIRSALPSDMTLTLGTGAQTGVYYPLGVTLCRLLRDDYRDRAWDCRVESTQGSVYNLRALRRGDMDIAIVQSDWQYHAYQGTQQFAQDGPFHDLRTLFSLHTEAFTVLVHASSAIHTLADLKGQRINIGPVGSGQRATFELMLALQGGVLSDFAKVFDLSPNEQAQALCDHTVDAIVYVAGHPNRSILEATVACDSRLIGLANDSLDRLIRDHLYYVRAQIPGGLYRGNPDPIDTFGVQATVVTSTRLPDETAYAFVEAALTHLAELRSTHPALMQLTLSTMIRQGVIAPRHPGAQQYLHDSGLLEWPRGEIPLPSHLVDSDANAPPRPTDTPHPSAVAPLP